MNRTIKTLIHHFRTRRLMVLILVAALLVPGMPVQAAEITFDPVRTGTVNVQTYANVRSGPGVTYDLIASLSNGAPVTVLALERDGGTTAYGTEWYKIRFQQIGETLTGYMVDDFITLDAEEEPTPGGISNLLQDGMIPVVKEGTYEERMMLPWTSPRAAIIGGAKFLVNGYIAQGQDTLYSQKFNYMNPASPWHQFMGNIEAPYYEGIKMKDAYAIAGGLDGSITFKIPVYKNMPDQPAPKPADSGSPNNWLKSLSIDGFTISPSLHANDQPGHPKEGTEEANQIYSVEVPYNTETIAVRSSAANSKASISPTGNAEYSITQDFQQIEIIVTAQNGTTRTYVLRVIRQPAPPTPSPTPSPTTVSGTTASTEPEQQATTQESSTSTNGATTTTSTSTDGTTTTASASTDSTTTSTSTSGATTTANAAGSVSSINFARLSRSPLTLTEADSSTSEGSWRFASREAPTLLAPSFSEQLDAFSNTTYHPALTHLHTQHPNWIFKAVPIDVDWATFVDTEYRPENKWSMISIYRDVSWRTIEYGYFDPLKDTYKPVDGSQWFMASKECVAYYMDPRNFLNETDVFIFEDLKFDATNLSDEIKNQYRQGMADSILQGTFMSGLSGGYSYVEALTKKTVTYSTDDFMNAFLDAAVAACVKPYHLASRARVEISAYPPVNNIVMPSASANGKYEEAYDTRYASVSQDSKLLMTMYNYIYGQPTPADLNGFFNFYNVGANASTIPLGNIRNGLVYSMFGPNRKAGNISYVMPALTPTPSPSPPPPSEPVLKISSKVLKIEGDQISGIKLTANNRNELAAFLPLITVSEGYTVEVVDSTGTASPALVGTGDIVRILLNGVEKRRFTVMLYGDVNGDGRVNSTDLGILLEHVMYIKGLTEPYLTAADATRNGKVNSSDLSAILEQVMYVSSIQQ